MSLKGYKIYVLGKNNYFRTPKNTPRCRFKVGAVAQSVEQRTENPCVGGSIPSRTTTLSARDLSIDLQKEKSVTVVIKCCTISVLVLSKTKKHLQLFFNFIHRIILNWSLGSLCK